MPAGGEGEDGASSGPLVTVEGAQRLHRALDPDGYALARERARRTIEKLAEGAKGALLRRVKDKAKEVPVETPEGVHSLAGAYAKIEHGQATSRGTQGGNVVVPIQINVNSDEIL